MKDKKIITVPGRVAVFNLPAVPGAKWFARRMPDADEETDFFGKVALHQTEAEARAVVDGWAPVEVIQLTEDMEA
jgi:hypothetical protein